MENDSRKSVPVMKECQTLNSGTPATPIPKYPNESISYQKYLEESEEYLSAFTQQTQPSTVWSAEKNYQPLYGKISIMSQSSEPQWYKLQSYLPHWDSRLAGRLNGGSTTSIFREWDSFQGSCQLINCSYRREKDSQKSVRTANAFPSGSSSTLAPPTPDQLRAVRNRFTSVKSSSSLYLSPSSLSMLAENHNLDKEGNNFIETNKTPQRNARRKRYQPKVLTEAESKQTLNLKTPISIETPRVEVPEEASKACKRALSFDMNDQARRDDSVHISNGDLNSQPEADNSSTANGHLSSNSSSDNGEQMRYSKRSRFCASVGNKEKTDLDATCSAFWQSKHMFLGNVNTNRIPSILFPEIYKKKRTEKGRWSYTSSTSSAAVSEDVSNETNPQNPSASEYYYCNPLHCNTKTRTVPNNQAKTALERTKTRIQLLQTWADIARTKKKRSKGPTRGCNFCPLRGISECPVKQRRKYAQRMKVDFQDNSVTCTGATVDVSNRPHSCVEALLEETKSTLRRKRRSKKQDNVFCSTSSNIHKMKMQLDLVLYGGDQSTRNSAGALLGLPWEVSIDTHTEGLKQLDIDRGRNIDSLQQQCALIPYHVKEQTALVYGKDGKMVPFEGPFSPVKKRHPRARVDLDDETSRVWKLLLESIDSKGIDGTDVENAKWWEQERGVFQGRVDSFIARMRLVQGDRRFTLWKGSIVDSVIGVFLTQNVADHLSSSAFMSMAARFPIKSENKHTLCSEVINALVKEQKIYILEPEHNIAYEKTIDQHICSKSSATLHDDEHSGENEVDNSKEVLGSSVGVSSECGNSQKVCNELRAHKANYYITKTEASSTGDDIARDNAASLQHSMLSSQNFVNSPSVQTVERMRLHSKSNSEAGELTNSSKQSKGMGKKDEQPVVDWDSLRKQAQSNGRRKRASNTIDSVDWEAVRCADVRKIADTIKERGMNNILADRIKDFLNRLVREHGAVDLEWLRDIPPDKAKEYLLSIRGLGLKSVECVRLLTLHHLAFPVDTNVGRIAVRLGWVPLQPLPESLQLHLLELYPILESIQKYLWPRLCKLDQKTLYELHYHMITFGKVFCTKRKPNCNACPLRGECRHFASAFASARLALPGPEEGSIVPFTEGIATHQHQPVTIDPLPLPPVLACQHSETNSGISRSYHVGEVQASALSLQEHYHSIPIVEVPESPELEYLNTLEQDIEDTFYEDPDEIPTIKLNMEEFTQTVQKYMQQNIELQAGCMSRALVALTPEAASIPTPKLKNVSRLRTEHHVYELPDKHPLLEGLDKREPDDPCSYLLAIWTPGETANCVQPPETRCNTQEPGLLCSEETCFQCNSQREANFYIVRGTLLIPCRTAMRGSFPLNGTYFQVNEVFADHDSSLSPIEVPREWLWNLARRTVYFGTSIQTIFKGLTTDEIQHCFWKGHVCVRGFDRKTRAPRPLMARLHLPASKMARARGTVNHPDATI